MDLSGYIKSSKSKFFVAFVGMYSLILNSNFAIAIENSRWAKVVSYAKFVTLPSVRSKPLRATNVGSIPFEKCAKYCRRIHFANFSGKQGQTSELIIAKILLDSFSNLRVIRIGCRGVQFLLRSHGVTIVYFSVNWWILEKISLTKIWV